jgi:transposase
VILMLDETIIREVPPLTGCYGHRGQQVQVPISGHHARRVLHGVLNIHSGTLLLLSTSTGDQVTHQAFLHRIRSCWRGWPIVLFEDRGSPHTANESLTLAAHLGSEVRFLPVATPELNAMDHLWRHMKRDALANRAIQSIDAAADAACQYLLQLSPRERLRKAGVLSGHFWLTS